VVIKNITKI